MSFQNIIDQVSMYSPIYDPKSYERENEDDDKIFYENARFVQHVDSLALQTIEEVIGTLIVEKNPVILDLMAGWDSHIPSSLTPEKLIGLGLNEEELTNNTLLDEYVIHDLNKDPHLPFPDCYFDVVLNTLSIAYITNPIQIFKEVGRILKPGGLFLVIFSNRMFEPKATKLWKAASEDERIIIVDELFKETSFFTKAKVFVSRGKPRPKNDKYASYGIPSDPIYAVYSDRIGGDSNKIRPDIKLSFLKFPSKEELEERMEKVKDTLRCPYCDEELKKWQVPENPFCQTWDNEYMYICFNDSCPYYVRGWDRMYQETFQNMSYRLMFNPTNGRCSPIPVPTPYALKEGIIQ